MKEKLSKSARRALNRELASIRKLNPGLTRAAFLAQRTISISNQGSLPDANFSQSNDWCDIAQKICRDMRNPYKELDACSVCPSKIKLGRLFDAEMNLTD